MRVITSDSAIMVAKIFFFLLVKRLVSLQVWPWSIFFHNTTHVHSLSERKLSIMAIKGLRVMPVVLCCERKNQSVYPSNYLFFFFCFHLLLVEPEVLPGQLGYVIHPSSNSWPTLWPLSPWTCQEHLLGEASQRHPDLLRLRSSSSTRSSTWMSEFLTLFLRLS